MLNVEEHREFQFVLKVTILHRQAILNCKTISIKQILFEQFYQVEKESLSVDRS